MNTGKAEYYLYFRHDPRDGVMQYAITESRIGAALPINDNYRGEFECSRCSQEHVYSIF